MACCSSQQAQRGARACTRLRPTLQLCATRIHAIAKLHLIVNCYASVDDCLRRVHQPKGSCVPCMAPWPQGFHDTPRDNLRPACLQTARTSHFTLGTSLTLQPRQRPAWRCIPRSRQSRRSEQTAPRSACYLRSRTSPPANLARLYCHVCVCVVCVCGVCACACVCEPQSRS